MEGQVWRCGGREVCWWWWEGEAWARRRLAGLRAGQILVWVASVPSADHGLVEEAALLDEEERRRADRFLHAGARREYLFGRALLRRLVGLGLGQPPEALVLGQRPGGKPFLRTMGGSAGMEFNLSHSSDRVLVALGGPTPVGVDLERVDSGLEWAGLGETVFGEEELAALRRVPGSERSAAFFRSWVMKEAVLKATGDGLMGRIRDVRVPAHGGGFASGVPRAEGAQRAGRWWVQPLGIGDEWEAALCFEAV